MRTNQLLLVMLATALGCLAYADGLMDNSTNPVIKIGDYSMERGTNGNYIFANPGEFWNGVWKEDTNGWRVQLRVYPETNFKFVEGRAFPLSTNLMLRVEWGSAVTNSGGGYYMSPNGKFARFELMDVPKEIPSIQIWRTSHWDSCNTRCMNLLLRFPIRRAASDKSRVEKPALRQT